MYMGTRGELSLTAGKKGDRNVLEGSGAKGVWTLPWGSGELPRGSEKQVSGSGHHQVMKDTR